MYHVTILQLGRGKLSRSFSTSKCVWNYYDVLKLERKCTAKEIKDSFIRLSKEFHPDINKRDDAHKKFLQINEAYKVLSNIESRRNYDLSLRPMHEVSSRGPYRMYTYNAEPFVHDPWKDPSFYANRDKSKDKFHEQDPYYGIRGIKRMSNTGIVLICLAFAAFGVAVQVFAIRNSFSFRREDLIKRSIEANEHLKKTKEAAAVNGNEVQIELLKLKFASRGKLDD
nr:unnamed protein product [Callosobruchus analis]